MSQVAPCYQSYPHQQQSLLLRCLKLLICSPAFHSVTMQQRGHLQVSHRLPGNEDVEEKEISGASFPPWSAAGTDAVFVDTPSGGHDPGGFIWAGMWWKRPHNKPGIFWMKTRFQQQQQLKDGSIPAVLCLTSGVLRHDVDSSMQRDALLTNNNNFSCYLKSNNTPSKICFHVCTPSVQSRVQLDNKINK